ncbi:hypothetical protein HGRIS_010162 [Hohenbuehelia grisea]|uniref:SET domain-containing protein n=1 Tax=Hohenbuehelia grisea TaxID=104357 RepID=A0ABR3J3G9_9AGAR
MNRTTTILTAASVAVAGVVAYAFYFDHKRRNDFEFRKQLRKDKKKAEKSAAVQSKEPSPQASSGEITPAQLAEALESVKNSQPNLTTSAEKEGYFMGQVSEGEQLATQGPAFYLAAATAFYRAMQVYPSPMELLAIYDKTVPKPIFELVMALVSLDAKDNFAAYFDHFPPKSVDVGIDDCDIGGQGARKVLVARKDFQPGDLIYKEHAIAATLDTDLQARGTHCTHCLRAIEKGMAIPASASDPFAAVYCSKPCQLKSKTQSHNLLFSLEPLLPIEVLPEPPSAASLEERRKAQTLLIEYLKKRGHGAIVLVARFLGRQVQTETAKQFPQLMTIPEIDYPSPDDPRFGLPEQVEHLRYLELVPPEGERKFLTDILATTLPGLEMFITDERYASVLGKMRYNSFGVCFGGGRDDRPIFDERPEDRERTRTPYGTARQIGSGIYNLSSYLSHSCVPNTRPSFSNGTAELHLIATKAIKKGDQLTVSYVDVTQHEGEDLAECYRRRRREIARGWRFACTCPRCKEDGPVVAAIPPVAPVSAGPNAPALSEAALAAPTTANGVSPLVPETKEAEITAA